MTGAPTTATPISENCANLLFILPVDKSEDTTLALVVKSGGHSHDRPASSPWCEPFFVLDF